MTVPQNRMTPLKGAWMDLYTPVTEKMKVDMRMNLKTRKVGGSCGERCAGCLLPASAAAGRAEDDEGDE